MFYDIKVLKVEMLGGRTVTCLCAGCVVFTFYNFTILQSFKHGPEFAPIEVSCFCWTADNLLIAKSNNN